MNGGKLTLEFLPTNLIDNYAQDRIQAETGLLSLGVI